MNDYTLLTSCLACGGQNLRPYFNAGAQPLANHFHDGEKELPRFPLGLNLCLACGHSQNFGAVDPKLMFEDYLYVSGTSGALQKHFEWFVDHVERGMNKRTPLRVLDIGANDGTLLQEFRRRGHTVIGVDPAKNIKPHNIPWVESFWNEGAANHVKAFCGQADAVVAMNVFAHDANPKEFLANAKSVLSPSGRIYIQVSQAHMVENAEFDTVYCEHISFFEDSSFAALAKRAGLCIESFSFPEVHGGSCLVELTTRNGRANIPPHLDMKLYDSFEKLAKERVKEVQNAIDDYRKRSHAIVGFGAAAKAMTFLNYGQIKLDCIVDENPLKIGKLTPGMNIPIHPAQAIASEPSKILFVITAWNFRTGIIEKIKRLRPGFNDTFLVYFPKLEIWE